MKTKLFLTLSLITIILITGLYSFTNSATEGNNPYVIDVTDQNFASKTEKGIVIVDFWATWCGPCRRQAPILDELAAEMKGDVLIAKLDVDKNKVIAGEYAVRSIPTLIVFKDGKAVKRLVGLTDKETLKNIVNSFK